jgi:hypothetical protein
MPWILLALGLGILVYAAAIRTDLHTDSIVCVDRPTGSSGRVLGTAKQTKTDSSSQATKTCSSLFSDSERERTTTRRITSDVLVSSIFGAGAILMLAGAFYSRVTKLTIAGQTVEMDAVSRRDAVAVSEAVARQAKTQIGDREELTDPHRMTEAVTRIAAATALAAEEVRELRQFAAGARVEAPIALDPARLEDLRRGDPLPPDVLERLAKRAVEEAFEKDADG